MLREGWRAVRRNPAPPWREPVVALVLAAVLVAGAATAPPARTRLDLFGALLVALGALVLPARGRAPRVVLAVTVAGLLVYEARGYPGFTPAVPELIAIYATVRAGYRWPAAGAIAVTLVGGSALARDNVPRADAFQWWFLLTGWMIAACVLAEVFRQHRAYLEQLRARAVEAERTREETARRRADEERLRIARELHDSLTHSISIIKVQAGVAVHLARKRDEPVPAALLAIQQASGEAMRELRATLEVLRADDRGPGTGLHRLAGLVEGARTAGLPVTVHVDGQPRALPEAVDRAAYRIIQEALTNVTRHAGPASASVSLRYEPTGLTVRIDDDGCADPAVPAPPGVGLVGMRERVVALGGTLSAGPRDGGGFSVRVALPLPEGA